MLLPLLALCQSKPKYPIDLPAYNIGSISEYTIQAKVLESNAYQYTISKVADPQKKQEFTLRPNGFSYFQAALKKAFFEVISSEPKSRKDELTKDFEELKVEDLNTIFFLFVAGEIAIDSYDFRPMAGELFFGKNISITRLNGAVKNELRKARRKAKLSANSNVNEVDLIKLRGKLNNIKKRIDSVEQKVGYSFLKTKIDALESSINGLLTKLKEDNYPESKESIQKEWVNASELYSEIDYLISKTSSFEPVSAVFIKRLIKGKYRYTVFSRDGSYPGLKKRKAKQMLKKMAVSDFSLNNDKGGNIKNIEIEFNEGFIENIKVIVDSEGKILKFENNYPIGFSTKRDYNILQNYNLFAVNQAKVYSIPLNEVIKRYEQKHEVDRRDYSPANQVISLDLEKESKSSVKLYKETTAKLFELKTFSDFVGFNQSSPNGLIQFEADKRLNLRTQRWPLPGSVRSTINVGQFITPVVIKSKLEDNNKHLVLNYRDEFTNGQYTPQRFTSTLELKRFENFSVGADLNMISLDFPSTKSTYYFNFGFRYGRVAIRDSLRTVVNDEVKKTGSVSDYGANTYTISPVKLLWEIKTDERYSFNLGWSMNLLFLRDNSFRQVANIPSFNNEVSVAGNYRYLYHNVVILTTLKPQPESTGRLFFRYQYNWQQGYWRTGFHQVQVGYSVYLTKQLKPS
jgi:hypothetical protein